jgi:hypothetical protein
MDNPNDSTPEGLDDDSTNEEREQTSNGTYNALFYLI